MDPSEAIYRAVRCVPRGRVVGYGQVADMVEGVAVTARQVGVIMATCPADVPWQRVVGAEGHLPIGKRSPELAALQRRLLEAEGVGFLADGRVDMAQFRWVSDEMGGLFAGT